MMIGASMAQQQKIDSKGNRNANTNINQLTIVMPSAAPKTKEIIRERLKTVIIERTTEVIKEEGWEGVLLPATDPIMEKPIPWLNNDVLYIKVGANIFKCEGKSCNVVASQGNELIWVTRESGVLRVNARVLRPDGKTIIATIEIGHFYVNRNQTYRTPERPDESTLNVFDQEGTPVLHMRYANAHVVMIEGIFNAPNGRSISVSKDRVVAVSNQGIMESGSNFYSGPVGLQMYGFSFGGKYSTITPQ